MRILCGITAPTLGRLSFRRRRGFLHELTTPAPRSGAAFGWSIRNCHCARRCRSRRTSSSKTPQHASARPGWRNASTVARPSRARRRLPWEYESTSIRGSIACRSRNDRWLKSRAPPRPLDVRLIVLDEPTSSLDLERSRQLRHYVRERARSGLAFIFISHKLHEIIDVASRSSCFAMGASRGKASRREPQSTGSSS